MIYSLESIRDAVSFLVEPFYEALDYANEVYLTDFSQHTSQNNQSWLRTANIRGLVYNHLVKTTLHQWDLKPTHSQNGQIQLVSDDSLIEVKFLKEAPRHSIPSAGHSKVRQAYYCQQPWQLPFDENELTALKEIEHKLLLLWSDVANVKENTGDAFKLRLIRPLTTGKFMQTAVESDMDITFPRTRSDFLNLEFKDVSLPMIFHIDEEEAGESDAC